MKSLVSFAIVLSTLFTPLLAQPTTTQSGVKVAKKKEKKAEAPTKKKAAPKKSADKK